MFAGVALTVSLFIVAHRSKGLREPDFSGGTAGRNAQRLFVTGNRIRASAAFASSALEFLSTELRSLEQERPPSGRLPQPCSNYSAGCPSRRWARQRTFFGRSRCAATERAKLRASTIRRYVSAWKSACSRICRNALVRLGISKTFANYTIGCRFGFLKIDVSGFLLDSSSAPNYKQRLQK